MAATIKDVCRVTGLSQGTVSKYLNNKPVSQKNCEKIRAAIEELGYQVNSIARGLRTNSAHTIGILIPDMGNILSTAIIETVESMLTMQQYSSIICFHHSDPSLELEKLEFLMSRQVDGLIIMPSEKSQRDGFERLVETSHRGLPIIIFNAIIPGLNCDTVMIDNYQATYTAVKQAFSAGHHNIGLVVASPGTQPTLERIKGYEQAYLDEGLTINKNYIQVCKTPGKTASYNACLDFFLRYKKVTAVIAAGYRTVLGCKKAIDDMLLKENRNILLIGFDCGDIADILSPKISYVHFPSKVVAKNIVMLLMKRINEEAASEPCHLNIPTTYVANDKILEE
ncbi:LacI family DNA-binding transcriptional regulator [Angelakisella massiliensis]|uniref:LacI family DNA-binding transcriptional regulator n=1 Tax=Angelakisella massiliensis TaxID=1871018 RepID=UPI0023A7F14A|nr:LacI family DNA-binding transcriptional regulator [Angelakisella massiliensis]